MLSYGEKFKNSGHFSFKYEMFQGLLRSLEKNKDLSFNILVQQKACNVQKYKSSLHILYVCVSFIVLSLGFLQSLRVDKRNLSTGRLFTSKYS